jgi:AcrR family transcriptional regulator
MNLKNDKQKSKKKIKDQFVELLKKRSIKKITVLELCQHCQINRSTFYTYFNDVYDLLHQIEADMAEEIYDLFQEKSENIEHLEVENLIIILEYIKKNQVFYIAFFEGSYYIDGMKLNMEPLWEFFFRPALQRMGIDREKDMIYYFEYFKGGFLAVIKRWIAGGCVDAPEHIAMVLRQNSPIGYKVFKKEN